MNELQRSRGEKASAYGAESLDHRNKRAFAAMQRSIRSNDQTGRIFRINRRNGTIESRLTRETGGLPSIIGWSYWKDI